MHLRNIGLILTMILAFPLLSLAARGLDIRVMPADRIYVCETNAARDYFDAMIYNIAYVNRSEEILTLDHVDIEAVKNETISQRLRLSGEDLERDAGKLTRMQSLGLLKLYDFMLQTTALLGESVALSPTLGMNPRTAIVSTSTYLSLKGIPDHFKITAFARTEKRELIESTILLEAVAYQQANQFIFPLRGAWWVGAGADVFTDHRWVAFEQFGYDLGQVGENGLTYIDGGQRLDDYFCFGRDVLAAADGEVVGVQTGLEDDIALLKQKGETEDAYNQRMGLIQRNFLKTDFTAAAGNFIVIRHQKEEYSFYAHLKKDSLCVKKGDRVKQGQVIAKVGHSGNSTEPHLHLQISNGPDPFLSRAVPVKFTYLQGDQKGEGYLRTGDIIRN